MSELIIRGDLAAHAAANLRHFEIEQGYPLITEAQWLARGDWREIIASRDGPRVRLVLLDALHPRNGALTRLIAAIRACELVPVIVEPNEILIDWCHRHGYRVRVVGKGKYRHVVWYPRRVNY